jgi:hypothetical protein
MLRIFYNLIGQLEADRNVLIVGGGSFMKRICLLTFIVIVTGLLFSGLSNAEEWRFPVGASYVSGFADVNDIYEGNLKGEEIEGDTGYIPVGLTFQPYLQLDNGLRLGAGIGPCVALLGDASYTEIPININAGYTLKPVANNIYPYFRTGFVHHLVSGDYIFGSDPGFFLAMGIELFRNKAVGLGIELAYDTSRIRMDKIESSLLPDLSGYVIARFKEDVKVGWVFSIYTIF